MRSIVSAAVVLIVAIPVAAQFDPPPTRYDLSANLEVFPQGNPKDTITSLLKTVERNRYDYLVAQLLDPKFVDAKINERAKLLETAVERDLRTLREEQKRNPSKYTPQERIPDDPKLMLESVRKEATVRAFKILSKEIREHLEENPDYVRELRKIMNEGTFTETGNAALATHKDIKNKTLYFRKIDRAWYLEDRTTEPATKPEAGKPEGESKEGK